jgi:hypothetical protein
VNAVARSIIEHARKLPRDERLAVASEIRALAEHDDVDPGAEAAWASEIELRAARALSGESEPVAWADVEARVGAVLDRK